MDQGREYPLCSRIPVNWDQIHRSRKRNLGCSEAFEGSLLFLRELCLAGYCKHSLVKCYGSATVKFSFQVKMQLKNPSNPNIKMSHTANIGPAFRNSFTLHFCSVSINMIPCHGTADAWCRNSWIGFIL